MLGPSDTVKSGHAGVGESNGADGDDRDQGERPDVGGERCTSWPPPATQEYDSQHQRADLQHGGHQVGQADPLGNACFRPERSAGDARVQP